MALLPETSGVSYPTPRQIENGEAQAGGLDGLWNEHARAMIERTQWLKAQLTSVQNGGGYKGVLAVTGTLVLTAADTGKCFVFDGSSPATLTLPALADTPAGSMIEFINNGTANLTVQVAASDLIDSGGAAQAAIAIGPNQSLKLIRVAGAPLWHAVGVPAGAGVVDQENLIINGAFQHWQRGTSSSNNGYVAADRWVNSLSGGTVTQSRQTFSPGEVLGANNPSFFLRQSVSGQTLSSHFAYTQQRIEGVRSYAAQTITVIGYARRSSGTGSMAVELEQFFGTGGSPSTAVVVPNPVTVALTGSWAPFAVTIAVPSITGKLLGTNGNDYLGLNFWTSAGSSFNARTNSLGLQNIGVDLWGVHIKTGFHTTSAVTLYRQPELRLELARCQRYFLCLAGDGRIAQGGFNDATSADVIVHFPVQMRVPPTGNASAFGRLLDLNVLWYNVTSLQFREPTPFCTTITAVISSSAAQQGDAAMLGGGGGVNYNFSFDAEL